MTGLQQHQACLGHQGPLLLLLPLLTMPVTPELDRQIVQPNHVLQPTQQPALNSLNLST
jgi:hypothetical protein